MRTACVVATSVGLAFTAVQAVGQTPGPYTIPLTYYSNGQTGGQGIRLGINVGIGAGGTSLPYLLDTGSSVFNAAYNPTRWGALGSTALNPTSVPASTVTNGNKVKYGFTGGGEYTGNILQVQQISLGGVALPLAQPGFQFNAVETRTVTDDGKVTTLQTFPRDAASPPVENVFYGTFGAGNFTSASQTGSYVGGTILGQAVVPGTTPGYIVAANGQTNISGTGNPPTGTQTVSGCSACIILGLTPQLIGQFKTIAMTPGSGDKASFPVAYAGRNANNAAHFFGANFQVTLANGSTIFPLTAGGAPGLLDSGTQTFSLNTRSLGSVPGAIADPTKYDVKPGTTLSVTGVSSDGGTLPASVSVLTGGPSYTASITSNQNGSADNQYTATLGISFFMQNSVLYDLTNNTIGYSPFFVTNADVPTTSGGSLSLTSANVPLGLAGVISGPGGVSVGSGAALQLSATNTYAGATVVNGAAGGLPAGQLFISGPGSIAASTSVRVDGILDVSGAQGPVSVQSLSGSGQIFLGGQQLVYASGTGTFSGATSDGGLYAGSGGSFAVTGGSLILAGNNTHTGGTTVAGGSLTLSGTLGGNLAVLPGGTYRHAAGAAFTGTLRNAGIANVNGVMTADVVNAGTLSGAGTITGGMMNGGAIAPGNSIGTLTVGGNYGQMAGSVYQAEVAGTGQGDLLRIGGRAALQGGTVSVVALPGAAFSGRNTYTLLTAAGGVTGTYASVTDPYPFLLPSLSYDANNVYLSLQIGGFAAAAQTPTQASVGGVLDANADAASGDFATVLSAMATNTLSNAQAQATLTALSGQNYSSFSSTMVQGAQLFMNNFANQAGGGGSPASNRVALAEACTIACDGTASPLWGAWGGALGGLGTIGANAGTGAVTYNAGGFAAGLDRLVAPGVRVGVTTGYTTGTQWTAGFSGQGTTDTFLAGLYGGYRRDRVYADAMLGYAYSYNQMWRQIFIPGLQQRLAQGRTGANQWYGQVEGGYRFDIGTPADATITPFARLQGYTGTQNGFTETGAQSLNLAVAGQTTNSLRSVVGAQLGGAIDLGWREKLALQVRLGWSHEYAGTARPVTATLSGAPLMPFTTWGIAPTRDGAVVGFSANTAIAAGTSAYVRYEGTISGQDSAHALTAGVRMTW